MKKHSLGVAIPFFIFLLALPSVFSHFETWMNHMASRSFNPSFYYFQAVGLVAFGALFCLGLFFLRWRWYGYLIVLVWYLFLTVGLFAWDFVYYLIRTTSVTSVYVFTGVVAACLVLELVQKTKHRKTFISEKISKQ